MAFVCTQKENIYVVYSDTIIISESGKEPKILKNPELTTAAPKKENLELQPEDQKDQENCEEELLEDSEKPVESTKALPSETGAVCCCLSVCGRLLAVADHAKRLIIWQCNEDKDWQVVSCRPTKRKCIRLTFCPSSQVVLAADRAGDVYSFSVSHPLESEKLLLGHLSMLLDLLISNDGKFVITSDRDEKIRVSHYPNTYNIQSYCLGHTEFVSALSLCSSHSDWLLSGSGDGTLRLWDYKSGMQLFSYSYKLNIPAVPDSKDGSAKGERVPAATLIETSEGSVMFAVLFDKMPCVGLYQLSITSGSPQLAYIQLVSTSLEPWDIKLNAAGMHLFILSLEEDVLTVLYASGDKLQFKQLPESDVPSATIQLKSFLNNQRDCLRDCKKRDDFQHLYKQWFDNMKTYLEKKELREKNKHNKCKKFKKLNSVK